MGGEKKQEGADAGAAEGVALLSLAWKVYFGCLWEKGGAERMSVLWCAITSAWGAGGVIVQSDPLGGGWINI